VASPLQLMKSPHSSSSFTLAVLLVPLTDFGVNLTKETLLLLYHIN
jgi:hypothetical protein